MRNPSLSSSVDWSRERLPLAQTPNDVHVWRLSLKLAAEAVPSLWKLLDEKEQHRARSFVHAQDRNRYVLAHAGLRQVLAQYLEVAPANVPIGVDPAGKPFVSENANDQPFQFSLTHSGDWALVAVARNPVGIDVEQERTLRGLDGLITRCCGPAERDALSAAAPDERQSMFVQYWVAKEAVLKAAGCGLKYDLRELEIPPSHGDVVAVHPPPRISETAWYVRWFAVDGRHLGALATSAGTTHVNWRHWNP